VRRFTGILKIQCTTTFEYASTRWFVHKVKAFRVICNFENLLVVTCFFDRAEPDTVFYGSRFSNCNFASQKELINGNKVLHVEIDQTNEVIFILFLNRGEEIPIRKKDSIFRFFKSK
jgi:hypothetical protein